MRTLKLTPPELAFVVATRAVLAAGVGLLVSGRLPQRARRVIGASLVAIGAITTLPALRLVAVGAR